MGAVSRDVFHFYGRGFCKPLARDTSSEGSPSEYSSFSSDSSSSSSSDRDEGDDAFEDTDDLFVDIDNLVVSSPVVDLEAPGSSKGFVRTVSPATAAKPASKPTPKPKAKGKAKAKSKAAPRTLSFHEQSQVDMRKALEEPFLKSRQIIRWYPDEYFDLEEECFVEPKIRFTALGDGVET